MTRWTIRDADNGRVLGSIDTADINYALSFARRRYGRNVTVDNRPPTSPRKAVIRYLVEAS